MNTYTEEELKAKVDEAIAAATAELQAKVQAFESSVQESEVEAKIAAAKAEAEAKVAEIQIQLDEKVLEAQSEREQREAIEAWLQGEAESAAREAEIAARREDRIAKVAEVAEFPDDYVQANAERWAGMDDEGFESYLNDVKVIASKNAGDKVPSGTAMTAARETTSGSTSGKVGSAVRDVLSLRGRGIDARTLA